jgi:XRE family transcriptional regulator, aerobic/anaerobic benzoate catabolism transcriptional regulator
MPRTDELLDAPVLTRLASRVRRLRETHGWSRAELAERSGLSVRFLARIEGGDGNVSLVRLAHLAEALGTPPDALLRAPRPRGPVVTLAGMRGAGKSTVGPLLAVTLSVPFVEMDGLIQEAAGLPLDQIFELHGERYYRRLERDTVQSILSPSRAAVVAAAGGVVNEPSTWKTLLEKTTVVWLRARPEDHWGRVVAQGDRRPMADNPDAMAELRAMLAAREARYGQAHVVVNTSRRSPEDVAAAIAAELSALERRTE